jgi:DNA-binding beta-propeller fold protein YncE
MKRRAAGKAVFWLAGLLAFVATSAGAAEPTDCIRELLTGGQVAQDVVAADLNRDGYVDLVIAFAYDDEVRWLYGGEGGLFTFGGRIDVGANPGMASLAPDDLPRSLAARDFDGDGLIDIAVLCSGNPNLFEPTTPSLGILYGAPVVGFERFRPILLGPSGFGDPAPQFATVLIAGLIDGDDRYDLVVGDYDAHHVTVITKSERRRWNAPLVYPVTTTGPGPVALAMADVNADGKSDLIVADRNDLQLWRGDGFGHFPIKTTLAQGGSSFTAVALADFDLNGSWDLAATDGAGSRLMLYMGLGLPAPAPRVVPIPLDHGRGPIDLACYDANRDGMDDIALVYWTTGGGDVLINRRNAPAPLAFGSHFATSERPRALAAADFDNNGYDDLAIVHESPSVPVGGMGDLVITSGPLPVGGTGPEGAARPGRALSPGLERPRGLAWDAGRQSLWTIDRAARLLVRLSPSGERLTTYSLAAATRASALRDPVDLAVDSLGHVWLADRLSARLFELDPDRPGGLWLSTISTSNTGILHPSGIACDRMGRRLWVSDEQAPLLAEFPASGTQPRLYRIENGLTALDLAADEARADRLWATLADEPSRIVQLAVDRNRGLAIGANSVMVSSPPMNLQGIPLRSLAADGPTSRVWLLTDTGALVYGVLGPRMHLMVHAIRELSLLRDLRAVAAEPDGNLWLGDSGILGTLVRIDSAGRVLETVTLGQIGAPPIEIRGLSVSLNRFYVLDGNSESIRVYSRQGALETVLGRAALLGRRPYGLVVRNNGARFCVATPGRVIVLDSTGARLEEHPIPLAPAGSLSPGPLPDEAILYSAERNTFYFLDAAWTPRRRIYSRAEPFPPRFRPQAATPVNNDASAFAIVGAGDPSYVLVRWTPRSAALRQWQEYK